MHKTLNALYLNKKIDKFPPEQLDKINSVLNVLINNSLEHTTKMQKIKFIEMIKLQHKLYYDKFKEMNILLKEFIIDYIKHNKIKEPNGYQLPKDLKFHYIKL